MKSGIRLEFIRLGAERSGVGEEDARKRWSARSPRCGDPPRAGGPRDILREWRNSAVAARFDAIVLAGDAVRPTERLSGGVTTRTQTERRGCRNRRVRTCRRLEKRRTRRRHVSVAVNVVKFTCWRVNGLRVRKPAFLIKWPLSRS